MKLAEALQTVNNARLSTDPPFPIMLCCGFTPLHLQTFFQAHMQVRLPGRKIMVTTGLYEDLPGNVDKLLNGSLEAAAIVVEWADLDARLGFRHLGGWQPSNSGSIVDGCERRLRYLEAAIAAAALTIPLSVALPGLALPPAFLPVNACASRETLRLEAAVADFGSRLAAAGARVVNRQTLDRLSSPGFRFDLKSDLFAGFPYAVPHTDILASLLADCLTSGRTPRKGLITDLDGTLWHGLVGEEGPQGISWSLDRHSQIHGIYQQMLASLAEQGTLIGVASKNDPVVVDEVFRERTDLLISDDRMFPLEIGWGPKSEAVARILRVWNVAADSVVFIDDSPIEIGEVQAAHGGMECILFPENDANGALGLFYRLRDLFGKDEIQPEDRLRLESIRQGNVFQTEAASSSDHREEFLAGLQAAVTWLADPPAGDARLLELLNKTNQFNLNGVRFSESEWRQLRSAPDAMVVGVSYEDKFGPLGTISVLAGRRTGDGFRVSAWVMSCRAFSRRIEYALLRLLFEQYAFDRIVFEFSPTAKNGPFREFVNPILGAEPVGEFSIGRREFDLACPLLYHVTSAMRRQTDFER